MRQGLSLKYVIGGGVSLLIVASLIVYVQRSVQNMQNITETLLWMSIEHTTTPARVTVHIHQALKDLVEEHRYLIDARHRTVVVNVQDGTYLLPAQACRIIFGILLRNALQYADEGDI